MKRLLLASAFCFLCMNGIAQNTAVATPQSASTSMDSVANLDKLLNLTNVQKAKLTDIFKEEIIKSKTTNISQNDRNSKPITLAEKIKTVLTPQQWKKYKSAMVSKR